MARDGELYLCAYCTTRLWHALTGQGWAISSVGGSSRWTDRIGVLGR
ncbi:hypothetical protein [Streptomyces sp. GbtcB6]|nr:hypothetical protein [Streptomyces sp. GbtcB6]